MENRKGTRSYAEKRSAPFFTIFHFFLSTTVISAGCGAPGEPVPPSPPLPATIKDLAAHQAGDGVHLTFPLPSISISGERLPMSPAVEILRGGAKPDGSADAKSFRVVYTIPGAIVANYQAEGRISFIDPLAPQETKAHPGQAVAYIVRTRASQKRASADSNIVTVRVYPVPAPIAAVAALVIESGVELSWLAPTTTAAGDPVLTITGYRICRSEIPATASASRPPE